MTKYVLLIMLLLMGCNNQVVKTCGSPSPIKISVLRNEFPKIYCCEKADEIGAKNCLTEDKQFISFLLYGASRVEISLPQDDLLSVLNAQSED